MLRVGIIGVGTVGASVANILRDNKNIITARAGKEIVPTIGVVSNLHKIRDVDIKLTDNIDDVLNDDSIDVVVELMGGIDKPNEIVRKALLKGKAVVTANKALLAYHRYELQELAGDIPFEFEAAVAGGIPIINALRDGLSANHIKSIQGIMNGTCNYMLTRMINDGVDYDEILKEAQDLGYAEADPTFDVGGFDAAHKLLILGSIAYGIDVKPTDEMKKMISAYRHPCVFGIANETKQRLVGARELIDVVLVQNDSNKPYTIKEEYCSSQDTVAVGVLDKAQLNPGEQIEMYIIRDKLWLQQQERLQTRPRVTNQK